MADVMTKNASDLESRCALLRSLHIPGRPLVLPNVWDVVTARAVEAAGFPVVATSSGAIAQSLGYEDHHGAPGEEMLAAAARIARGVGVPVTVDAEAGYKMAPGELVAALQGIGAAGCNLEDTDHERDELVGPGQQTEWLAAVRRAADEAGYPLVINARIDVFLANLGAEGGQGRFLDEALERAHAYFEAGVDCVYPIALHEREVVREFVRKAPGPVNLLPLPQGPALAELAELGAARVSYGTLLHRAEVERFGEVVREIAEAAQA